MKTFLLAFLAATSVLSVAAFAKDTDFDEDEDIYGVSVSEFPFLDEKKPQWFQMK